MFRLTLYLMIFISCVKSEEASPLHELELTAEDQQRVLDFHNDIRSKVIPPATNMLKMVYDIDVANIARNFSRLCIYNHNKQAATSKYPRLGENIFFSSNPTNVSYDFYIAVKSWMEEAANYNYKNNICKDKYVCGHYTQAVWAESYALGCGITTCRNMKVGDKVMNTSQFLVCNYGPGGNMAGEHPYIAGPSRSECPEGMECVGSGAISLRFQMYSSIVFFLYGAFGLLF